MAKRKRGNRGGGGSSRSTRSKSKKSAASAAPVEVVEEEAGEGIDTGILVMTFVLLLAACVMTDMALSDYGAGVLF